MSSFISTFNTEAYNDYLTKKLVFIGGRAYTNMRPLLIEFTHTLRGSSRSAHPERLPRLNEFPLTSTSNFKVGFGLKFSKPPTNLITPGAKNPGMYLNSGDDILRVYKNKVETCSQLDFFLCLVENSMATGTPMSSLISMETSSELRENFLMYDDVRINNHSMFCDMIKDEMLGCQYLLTR